jgi:hypothetical protein
MAIFRQRFVLCEQNPVHVVFVVNRFVTFTFCGIMQRCSLFAAPSDKMRD